MRTPTTYRGMSGGGEPFSRRPDRHERGGQPALTAGVNRPMSRLNPTRHNLPAALLLTALLLIVPAASAKATPQESRYSWVPPKICKIDWRKGTWHVKQLIRCAADHWDVPGGASMALYVANRESHFYPARVQLVLGRERHLPAPVRLLARPRPRVRLQGLVRVQRAAPTSS